MGRVVTVIYSLVSMPLLGFLLGEISNFICLLEPKLKLAKESRDTKMARFRRSMLFYLGMFVFWVVVVGGVGLGQFMGWTVLDGIYFS